MAYGGFKNFTRRTVTDKVLCDEVFNIAKNRNMADINADLPH